jgi:hypothetical protein
MSDQTGATEKQKKPRRGNKFRKVVDHIDNMSVEQFRQTLIAAGIATENGELSEKYKRPQKPKKTPRS